MENTKVRKFSSFIEELRDGVVNEELSLSLSDLVREVEKQQKAGSLDLKIKLIPNKGDGTLFVQAQVSTKEPKPEPPVNIFYVDQQFNLRREDPRQMKFGDLQSVTEDPPQKPKTVEEV